MHMEEAATRVQGLPQGHAHTSKGGGVRQERVREYEDGAHECDCVRDELNDYVVLLEEVNSQLHLGREGDHAVATPPRLEDKRERGPCFHDHRQPHEREAPLATAAGELSPRANIVGVSNSAQRSSSDPCTIYTSMFGDFVSL